MLAPHAIGSLTFDDVRVAAPQTRSWASRARASGWPCARSTCFAPAWARSPSGWRRTALDLATAYAVGRETFGKRLSEHQAVAHRIAELHARTEAARLLVHQAAGAHDAGSHDPALAAMAKLLATETAQTAVDAAIQFHGAVALERGHQSSISTATCARHDLGAPELQREIIARALFRAAESKSKSGAGPGPGRGRGPLRERAAHGGGHRRGQGHRPRDGAALCRRRGAGHRPRARRPWRCGALRTDIQTHRCDVTDEAAVARVFAHYRPRRRARQQRRHGRVRAAAPHDA